MKRSGSDGFSVVGVLIVVVAVGLLGLAGWRVYDARQAKDDEQTISQQPGQPKEENAQTTVPYENEELGISFDYPKEWKLVDCDDEQEVIYLGSDDRGVGIVDGASILCAGGNDFPPQISMRVKPGNDHLGVTESVMVAGRKAEKYTQVADDTGLYAAGLEQTVYIVDLPEGVLEISYVKWPAGVSDYDTSKESKQKFTKLVEESLRIL